jgi:hypothetical protein
MNFGAIILLVFAKTQLPKATEITLCEAANRNMKGRVSSSGVDFGKRLDLKRAPALSLGYGNKTARRRKTAP